MRVILALGAKFVICLAFCLVLCMFLWQAFACNKLCNCTDGIEPLDFLFPGDWVHHPVVVAHVVAGRSMSEPDTVKVGWTMRRLWALWCAFVLASLILSAYLASLTWGARGKSGGDSSTASP